MTKTHRVVITLLGGTPALVVWSDGQPEGEIVMDGAFLTYIHEHTRRDAIAKARFMAPHVENWITCAG